MYTSSINSKKYILCKKYDHIKVGDLMSSDEVKTKQINVSPGECPPEGCPPPVQIECIVVDKVYDSCFQRESLPLEKICVMVDTDSFAPGEIVPCILDNAAISCTEIERTPLGNGFFEVVLAFNINNLMIQNPNNPQEILPFEVTPFIKTLTLCCPEGTYVDCSESTIIRCICIVKSITPVEGGFGFQVIIVCQIAVCLVFKCISRVQLLVPSYGFCVPAPCIALPGVCPPALPAQCF